MLENPELISKSTGISELRAIINEGYVSFLKGEVDGDGKDIVLSKNQCDILIPLALALETEVKLLKEKLETVLNSRYEILNYLESQIISSEEHSVRIGKLAIYWVRNRRDVI
jgi:hypothetical protein